MIKDFSNNMRREWRATNAASRFCRSRCAFFRNAGFSGTTTKEIANAAGVSEAMVFQHFSNKDELYAAISTTKRAATDFRIRGTEICREDRGKKTISAFFTTWPQRARTSITDDRDFLRLLLHSALEGHELARDVFREFYHRSL